MLDCRDCTVITTFEFHTPQKQVVLLGDGHSSIAMVLLWTLNPVSTLYAGTFYISVGECNGTSINSSLIGSTTG